MPARVVLSPDRLGILPYEHKALLEIRGLFAAGKFWHDPDSELLKPDGFNMNTIVVEGDCGTTCCIGGWMFLAMQRDRTAPCISAYQYVHKYRSQALCQLFMPFIDFHGKDLRDQHGQSYDFPYELMPPAFALTAIDNFLATGNPNWPAVTGLLDIETPSQAA